jgi:hypothetical protein
MSVGAMRLPEFGLILDHALEFVVFSKDDLK